MAFGMNVQSRPRATEDPSDLVGRPLRDIAALAKSWNFEDAGIGMAAVNSYHSHPEKPSAHRLAVVPKPATPYCQNCKN